MNIDHFNMCINEILEDKKVESIPLDNLDILRELLFHKRLNKKFYNGFENYYQGEFGKDLDYFVLKVQDMIYRLHLLVNHLVDNVGYKDFDSIYNSICTFLKQNSISFYEAVNYNASDIEILEEEYFPNNESISIK